MDSRSYIFIFPLKVNADIPADFQRHIRSLSFEMGVFMPQDDANWFTRPPRYPARLLLLEGRSLYIVPHPTSEQSTVEVKLDDLLQLETGCILLLGWMNFTTRAGVQELIYNTRGSRPLEEFLNVLKRRWLGKIPPLPNTGTLAYGDELDIKFRNSIHFELDREEAVLARYFRAPAPTEKKFLFFRRVTWRPGSLVLWTSRNRIVWITDQYRQRRELYVSIGFSAPSSLFLHCELEEIGNQRHLAISFASGITWRIPVYEASKSSSICEVLNQIPGSAAAPKDAQSEALGIRPEVVT